MTFLIGVAMAAFSIVAVRGAFLLVHAPSAPHWTRNFLTGQLFAVFVTGMLATGPILIADSLATGSAQSLSLVDLGLCAALVGAAVVVWLGLGRWIGRVASATVSDLNVSPPTRPTTHGASRKRAA